MSGGYPISRGTNIPTIVVAGVVVVTDVDTDVVSSAGFLRQRVESSDVVVGRLRGFCFISINTNNHQVIIYYT